MPRSSSAGMQRNIRSLPPVRSVCPEPTGGLPHLVPYPCALDMTSVDWMGGRLYRTKTLAAGGDCCDFYICKKGSPLGQRTAGKIEKRKIDGLAEFRRTYPPPPSRSAAGNSLPIASLKIPRPKSPRWSCSTGDIGLSDHISTCPVRQEFSVLVSLTISSSSGDNGEVGRYRGYSPPGKERSGWWDSPWAAWYLDIVLHPEVVEGAGLQHRSLSAT